MGVNIDAKLIASRKQAAALQSSLVANSKASEDWQLILNPSTSEHLRVGDTSQICSTLSYPTLMRLLYLFWVVYSSFYCWLDQ